MALRSIHTRLAAFEQQARDLAIRRALAKARDAPRAAFAATLLAALPGTTTHVWIDWDLLSDEELKALAGEGGA